MNAVVKFQPRPQDRQQKATIPPVDDVLPEDVAKLLDNLINGMPWTPGQRRPRGTLELFIQGSYTKFVLKVMTQSDTGKTILGSMPSMDDFKHRYMEWLISSRVRMPAGFDEFKLIHAMLLTRRMVPWMSYEPESGLGVVFGYRMGDHTQLLLTVEYAES
jgi:hypothetical protein